MAWAIDESSRLVDWRKEMCRVVTRGVRIGPPRGEDLGWLNRSGQRQFETKGGSAVMFVALVNFLLYGSAVFDIARSALPV